MDSRSHVAAEIITRIRFTMWRPRTAFRVEPVLLRNRMQTPSGLESEPADPQL
jgi:hypothetical protein